MPWSPIRIAVESYAAATPIASIQRLTNLFPEQNPEGSEFPFTLRSAPGLKSFASVSSGPIRGMIAMGSILFVVSGSNLYTINSLGTVSLVGPVSGSSSVRMTTNGTHVVICTSTNTYCATATTIITLPQSGLNGATYQDGYGIYTQSGTQNVWISGIDDLTSIDPLDFTTADASYDNVVGCISDHRELVIFKEKTTEIFNNTGSAAFPFERSPAGFLERGCACAGTIAKAGNMVHWLGDDLGVYQMVGYQPQRISTPGIDTLIKAAASPRTAEGFVISYFGHVFYCLAFSDLCLLFDLTTGKWSERQSYGIDRWRANCHTEIWGKQLVGDYSTGDVYELDEETYDENGDALVRSLITPHVHGSGNRTILSGVKAIFEPGVGLTSGQGSDPQAGLCWSDDDGRSWSNNLYSSIGQIGRYDWQTRWNRLGQFRRRSLKIFVSDPVSVSITGLYADVAGLAS